MTGRSDLAGTSNLRDGLIDRNSATPRSGRLPWVAVSASAHHVSTDVRPDQSESRKVRPAPSARGRTEVAAGYPAYSVAFTTGSGDFASRIALSRSGRISRLSSRANRYG